MNARCLLFVATLVATSGLTWGAEVTATNAPSAGTTPKRLSPEQLLARAAAEPAKAPPGAGWKSLFDGRSLGVWQVTDFAGHGEVEVKHGLLVLGMGGPFTGVNVTSPPVRMDYELTFEATRVAGSDFFCALTFPVGTNYCSLIVGGWGGGVVGISSLDGADASENETTKFLDFEPGRWYRVRVRVTTGRLEAWLDDRKVVNVVTEDRRLTVRAGEIEMSMPLGLASYSTTAGLRGMAWRPVTGPDATR